ncbi:hypothetical protein C8A00DRAFT_37122 [Chaetomidium leptoderma]|uniref:DJ-1/PfpI domain-containing protein n=1 Tax=Chaetomidium leptoderma TaxID=669021 RepID=A0AAN6VFE9_9PEZI|nr:hypothetical protein C8A00DRAFT_37122 [Chaetomidium leptoderma]
MKIQASFVASTLVVTTQWLPFSLAQQFTLTPEQEQNANRTLSVGYVVYDGYTILDVFGPMQFLFGLSWPLNVSLSVIAKAPGPVHSRPPLHHGSDGMAMDMTKMVDAQIVATHSFATAPPVDVLVVPGGLGDLTLLEQNDRTIEDFIAARFATTPYVLSVCTGAGFLARAGVLEGRRATATKGSWAHVTRFGQNVTWVPSARWVRDGKVWTSSGVSAGMDMMVAFLRHVYGDAVVNRSVNDAEYAPVVDPEWDPYSVIQKKLAFRRSAAAKATPANQTVQPGLSDSSGSELPLVAADHDTRIGELWEVAYHNLRREDEASVQDYEDNLFGNLGAGVSSMLGTKAIGLRERMDGILQRKMINNETWKLRFGSTVVLVKDVAQPVMGIINRANQYITGAVDGNPYASVAWAGVALLLPLVLNPSEHATSLARALEHISGLVAQSRMWEELYVRRYEAEGGREASFSPQSRDRYTSDPTTALAYFYFSFSDLRKQNVVGLLSSLVKQLCCRRPILPRLVESLSEYKERGERPDAKTLEAMLQEAMGGFSAVHIVIDALDECPVLNGERGRLLDTAHRIATEAPANLHMFCTSRRESDIDAVLSPLLLPPGRDAIDLTATAVIDHDIGLYIDSVLASPNFSSWPDNVKMEARASLIKKADGMFQYVAHQFAALRNLSSVAHIHKTIQELPVNLDATYDRLLQSIDPKFQPPVASTLRWLACSRKVFKVEELAEIFILDPDMERTVAVDEAERLFEPRDVLKYLSGLVYTYEDKYLGGVTYVRLAHFSVKEYLVSHRITQGPAVRFAFSEADANLHVARSCLVYHLQCCALADSANEYEAAAKESSYPLGDYAAQHWPEHLEAVPREMWPPEVTSAAARALAVRSRSFCQTVTLHYSNDTRRFWFKFEMYDDTYGSWRNFMLQLPLCFTAWFGLVKLTDMLMASREYQTQEDVDAALVEAAYQGRTAVVDLLLDGGADVNVASKHFGDALQAAAFAGEAEIVERLLDRGADIDAQRGGFGSALHAACAGRRWHVVQLLVRRKANVHLTPNHVGSVLMSTINKYSLRGGSGRFPVLADPGSGTALGTLQLLLDLGADVNLRSGKYGYPLQALCTVKDLHMNDIDTRHHADRADRFLAEVELLLDKGANVNARGGGYYGNALQASCYHGKIDVAEALLDLGVDVRCSGGQYGSPLQAAAASATIYTDFNNDLLRLLLLRLLLDHGADVHHVGGEYATALQSACARCRWNSGIDIPLLLFQHGADVHVQGGHFGSAWHAAVTQKGNLWEDLLQRMLDRGVDVNDARGRQHATALQAALENTNPKWSAAHRTARVRFLLDRGADVNLRAGQHGFPLQSACCSASDLDPDSTETIVVVKFLLDNCPDMDVNAQGGKLGTALQAAAYWGQTRLVEVLLRHGARVDLRGGKYGSALNAAVVRGFWDIVKVLLDAGATPDCRLLAEPDKEWLAHVRYEHGRGGVERYSVFWDKHKPT